MWIGVKILEWKWIWVEIHLETDTITDVEFKIYDKSWIPLDQQRLTLAGQELEEGRMLSNYDIRNLAREDKIIQLGLTPLNLNVNMDSWEIRSPKFLAPFDPQHLRQMGVKEPWLSIPISEWKSYKKETEWMSAEQFEAYKHHKLALRRLSLKTPRRNPKVVKAEPKKEKEVSKDDKNTVNKAKTVSESAGATPAKVAKTESVGISVKAEKEEKKAVKKKRRMSMRKSLRRRRKSLATAKRSLAAALLAGAMETQHLSLHLLRQSVGKHVWMN